MNNERRIPNRADTPEGKRLVMERILTAWMRVPEQRLGQLIVNAEGAASTFGVEDFVLADQLETYAVRHGK